MRDITHDPLLALIPSLSFGPGRRERPSSRPGPKPVQPARPLTLPTLRPPVADTGIFSPLPLPAAKRDPPGRRRSGTGRTGNSGSTTPSGLPWIRQPSG